MHKAKAFTIVELLIVIAVIAILAAIGIVSYASIQQRARNTQTVSAVSVYQKAFQLYASQHSVYPVAPDMPAYGACLGDGYTEPCWLGTGGTYTVNTWLDERLNAFMSSKPAIDPKYHAEGASNQRSGIVYFRNEPSGRQSIAYILEGRDQACQLTGAVAVNTNLGGTGTRCRLVLPET